LIPQTRFLLSPDKEFSAVGSRSKIEYQRDFEYYKQLIIKARDKAAMKQTFSLWNMFIFGKSKQASTQFNSEEHRQAELEDALDALDLSESSDDGNGIEAALSDLGLPSEDERYVDTDPLSDTDVRGQTALGDVAAGGMGEPDKLDDAGGSDAGMSDAVAGGSGSGKGKGSGKSSGQAKVVAKDNAKGRVDDGTKGAAKGKEKAGGLAKAKAGEKGKQKAGEKATQKASQRVTRGRKAATPDDTTDEEGYLKV
jgi:hypothetical protein